MKKIILNPFEKFSDRLLLLIGLLSVAFGAFTGWYFNARYDGVFDLHFTDGVVAYQPLSDIVISVGVTILLLFFLGKYINPKTRLIDTANTCLIAKIPFYFLAPFNFRGWIYNCTTSLMAGVQENVLQTPSVTDLLPILVFSIVTLGGLVLSIVLLFNGYKVASNAKGMKSTWLFVAAIFVSEILSKVIISYT